MVANFQLHGLEPDVNDDTLFSRFEGYLVLPAIYASYVVTRCPVLLRLIKKLSDDKIITRDTITMQFMQILVSAYQYPLGLECS